MCMCISLTEATTCKNDTSIEIVSTQSTINRELRMYPEEVPCRGIGGSIRTRYSALLEVMDHSRCRKRFAVQSHELSPGRRRRRRGRAVTESLPKNLIAAHPVQGSQADEGSRGTCCPDAPCAQRYGTGKTSEQLRCGISGKRAR
jgi:hypothetical protein